VVVTSTWGTKSLFGRHAELLRRLSAELPGDRYRLAALLHPNVWFGHGVWQIRAWLDDCLRRGLVLVPPEADWRGALVAADHIVCDHGSVAVYGTVTGAPILLTGTAGDDVDQESAGGVLAATAQLLNPDEPLTAQLASGARCPADYAAVVDRLTSAPGRFAPNMRRLIYRELRLTQPRSIPRIDPVPAPCPA
jgi:hypothetical protein